MTRQEAEEYAKNMTYQDAIHNALQGKCIPYRKATLIKLHELSALEQLPPVTPRQETVTEFADRCRICGKQRRGHWIKSRDEYGNNHFTCSECGHDIATQYADIWDDKYCSECGTKMESKNNMIKDDLKSFAARLNGREYLNELTKEDYEYAEEHGIVVVFGQSDDLIEFEGAISDEDGCYDGGIVYFDKNGFVRDGSRPNNSIRAVWCGKDEHGEPLPGDFKTENGEIITWCYITDIPHETFMIYDEDEPYCRGIVFSIGDLK